MSESQGSYTVVMRPSPLLGGGIADPFKVTIHADDERDAHAKAGRLLKRTYGDGTREGNPMYWTCESVEPFRG